MIAPWVATDGSGVLLRVKAVPGAKRPGIAGVLGDRLKVKVSAPAEGGKANDAIRAALAGALGLGTSSVEIIDGHTSPAKTFRIEGVTTEAVRATLGA